MDLKIFTSNYNLKKWNISVFIWININYSIKNNETMTIVIRSVALNLMSDQPSSIMLDNLFL